jgi:hypothetical protein
MHDTAQVLLQFRACSYIRGRTVYLTTCDTLFQFGGKNTRIMLGMDDDQVIQGFCLIYAQEPSYPENTR